MLISFGLHLWIFSTKGHGEMQEQKLRRRWKLASQHHGRMQEEPISIAFAALLISVSYSSLSSDRSLYTSWSMKSFWFVNCSICASLSVNESVSVQVSSCPIQNREDMNMYLSYNNVFLHYLFSPLLSLFFWHKMQRHPAPNQGTLFASCPSKLFNYNYHGVSVEQITVASC